MYNFLAFGIHIGNVRLPNLKLYWSTDPIYDVPFICKIMSYHCVPKTKRARFGIKMFNLCESETGYVYNSIIYCGKQSP